MPTVKLVDERSDDPRVRAVFDDIKATKKIDRVPDIWRARRMILRQTVGSPSP
jgi:hypothetical protein